MDRFSFLNAASVDYFAELYNKYLQNPDSVEPSWKAFFQGFDFASESLQVDGNHPVNGSLTFSVPTAREKTEIPQDLQKEFQVVKLIDGYRTRGHLFTRTNPVRERRKHSPTLAIENFGLSEADMQTTFNAGQIIGIGPATLREIIDHLQKIYCESIGLEYMYIRNPGEIQWIQAWLNKNDNHPAFTAPQKKHILRKLTEAVTFENFLHTKYVGQKRFSLEGGESLIPALDAVIEKAAEYGVEQFVMGMAHRGRLNVLANIFGKPAKDIFSEFEGKDYEQAVFDGDVKYHLGWTSHRDTDTGKSIHMNLAPNPSHLEAVGAIVQGITRSKQDRHLPGDFSKALSIIVHGDAAIAGQGIVYEIVQMAQLDGYKTHGTIHIVVNNQIGFTTNYLDGRSSTYCTDVGKVTLSPVLHINADDAEAVVHASLFALDFRMAFQRDVFIDLLGYRKYGHNEGDEPRFTQPTLYKMIASHKDPKAIYAEKLLAEGAVTSSEIEALETAYKASLEEKLEDSRKQEKALITPFMEDEWEGYLPALEAGMLQPVDTTYPAEKLARIAEVITTLPASKKFIRKTERLIEERHEMFFKTRQLDWAMGELLAYGSLLEEGYHVRISGQDVERGTFSHRHAVIKVEDSEEEVILLDQLGAGSGKFYIYNSLLSEYAVLGFDYGYAMASPNTLTVWEAQFGDFSNGAQIVIDQYLAAGEDKWDIQNGLVLLLPHGYEGQGAEHSSARMERYLQLCAKDNMFVANCTTPANFYHLLRRQMKVRYRKPLVVFTPKSLLRHPQAVSTVEELVSGNFLMLIEDGSVKREEVKTLVFCTGKFYYDLLEARSRLNRNDVALVRLEQLFPLPAEEIRATIASYQNAEDVVWAQEEPRNMGAWSYLLMQLPEARNFRVASRRFYASPASGSSARDKKRQAEVVNYVFDKTKDTMYYES